MSTRRGDPVAATVSRRRRTAVGRVEQSAGAAMAGDGLVRARAPLRVSFAGGGTDVPPFPDDEGGLVLSATINRYAYGTLRPRRTARSRSSRSTSACRSTSAWTSRCCSTAGSTSSRRRSARFLDKDARASTCSCTRARRPGSGLGSSSAMIVALIGLLQEYYRLPLTDYEIAELAYMLEREDLGIQGGLQDQYAATFGGFNFIEFAGDRVVVNPLRIDRDVDRRARAQPAALLHRAHPAVRPHHRRPDRALSTRGRGRARRPARAEGAGPAR